MGKNKNKNKTKLRLDPDASNPHPTHRSTSSTGAASYSGSGITTPDTQYSDGTNRRPSLASYTSCESDPRQSSRFEKRDSVISTQAEDDVKPQPKPARKTQLAIRPCRWWPCRAVRHTYDFVTAFFRVLLVSRHWLDQVYTLVFLFIFLFGCWLAIEGLLQIARPVAAQSTNCSPVLVTVPGPIITISLVPITASDPAHGTYYYSVVNGTTEWLNSVAPPGRYSASSTGSRVSTPIPSPGNSLASRLSSIVTPTFTSTGGTFTPSLPAPPIPPAVLPGSTFITTILTGTSLQSLPAASMISPMPVPRPSPAPIGSSLVDQSMSPPLVATSVTTDILRTSTILLTLSGTSFPPSGNTFFGSSPPIGQPPSNSAISPSQPSGSLPFSIGPTNSDTSMIPASSPLVPPMASSTGVSSMFTVSLPKPSSASFSLLPIPSQFPISNGPTSSPFPSAGLVTTPTFSRLPLASSQLDPTNSLPSTQLSSSKSGASLSIPPALSTFVFSTISGLASSSFLGTSLGGISSQTSGSGPPGSQTGLPAPIQSPSPPPPAVTSSPEWAPPSIWFNTTSTFLNSTQSFSYSITRSRSVSNINYLTSSRIILVPSATQISGPSSRTPIFSLSSSGSTGISPTSSKLSGLVCSGTVSQSGCLPQARNLMTKVVSYGEADYTFVFPTPEITTTISYWTGTYPTVTGPEPTELPLTTRIIRQTPLSGLPPLELFRSSSSGSTKATTTMISSPILRRGDSLADIAAMGVADPEPTHCGESGNFTLGFDDSTVGPADDDIRLPVNGMKNPYHHLFYANGFTYVPDKWEPYPAVSQPNVAMFLPLTGRLLPNTPFAGSLLPGELGGGPRASVNAYWFNAYSGFFGCALSGITPCTLRVSGYRYDATLKQEVLAAEQNVTIPACYGYINCRLTPVSFTGDFRGLSGIQFNAFTKNLGIPQAFMMDDLQLEWYNNTCSAGILRIGHR